jgi:hypothetical protein
MPGVSFTLKMEELDSSETSTAIHEVTYTVTVLPVPTVLTVLLCPGSATFFRNVK